MKRTLVTLLFIIGMLNLSADEGMWMLHLLRQQKLTRMQQMGLQLEELDIYNPDGSSLKDAVAEVADALGLPRREVYGRALALTRAR